MLSEEDFKYKYLQQPITFLTEENLDKLETHCRKAIRYERGVEHRVVLELLERYEEFLAEREQDKKRIKELEEENKILEFQNKQVENYAEELKKYNKTVSDRIVEYKKNSIPVKRVKETIENIKEREEK